MQVGTTKDQGLYNKPSAVVHPGVLAARTLPQYNTIQSHSMSFQRCMNPGRQVAVATNFVRWRLNVKLASCQPSGSWISKALELYLRRKNFESGSVYCLSLLNTLSRRQLGWILNYYFHSISYSSFTTEILVRCNNRISCS